MERKRNSRKFSKDEEKFVLTAQIVDLLILSLPFSNLLSGGDGVWGDGLGVCVVGERSVGGDDVS